MIILQVEPTWRIMEQFVVRNLQTTFVMDAMKDAHAMNVAVGSPEGIIAAFDYVSYSKGKVTDTDFPIFFFCSYPNAI